MMALIGICGYAVGYQIKEKYCQVDLMQVSDGQTESSIIHLVVIDSMLQNKLKLVLNRKMLLCKCICTLEIQKNTYVFYLKDIEIEEGGTNERDTSEH